MQIKRIDARKIIDSRGVETIEVIINGCRASSPSGTSTGKYESSQWHKSLSWNINSIKKLKIDFEINSFDDLRKIENLLVKNFKLKKPQDFGANALFALESAILKALAKSEGKELWQIVNEKARKMPIPLGNVIGGGMHSKNFKVHPTFQEFLLVPNGSTIYDNVKIMEFVYIQVGRILGAKKVNYEGAWNVEKEEIDILNCLNKFRDKVKIGLDVAASSFYKNKRYAYNNKIISRIDQINFINNLIDNYSLIYVEDPLDEEDFSGFAKINKKTIVTGDDLTVTHVDRLSRAIKNKSINGMIIKPNQNGSLIQLKEIFNICKKHKIKTILSHRSGETMDNAIADYAFAFGADFIKCGIATKWRKAKLNRLIEIEKAYEKA